MQDRRRIAVAAAVTFLLLILLVVAGRDEAEGTTDGSLYASQVAEWDALPSFEKSYFCAMPRRDAVALWAAGIADIDGWWQREVRVSKRVLARGCGKAPWS